MKKSSGFTLLEVIVALVVVVVGLILISQAFSIGLRAVKVSDKSTIAKLLAEQKMTEIDLQPFTSLQSATGDFGQNYPGYTWTEEVTTTTLDNLRQITLTISWQDENTSRSLVITTLRADHGDQQAAA